MQKSKIKKDIPNQRYLTVADGCIYYQLGRNTLRALSDKANATRHIGRRVLIDKIRLDDYLETKGGEEER